MAKMLDNPEFLKTTLNMLKSPMGRPQVDQMAKQMNISGDTLLRVLDWLLSAALFYKKIKPVVGNPIFFYGVIVLIVSYLLYWTGFTRDLLFMMPFR